MKSSNKTTQITVLLAVAIASVSASACSVEVGKEEPSATTVEAPEVTN